DLATIDRDIEKAERRLQRLRLVRGLISVGQEAPACPKARAPADPGPAVTSRSPKERVLLALLTHSRLTSSQLAEEAGVNVKALSRLMDPQLTAKKGGRLGAWALS